MGKSSKGGRGKGRSSSRAGKSSSSRSSKSSGGSSSSSSGGSKSSGGSSSRGGGKSSGRSSSASRGSSSKSSGVSTSVSSAKPTATISSTSPAMSSSVSMGVSTTNAAMSKNVSSPVASSTYGSFIGPSGKVTKIKGVDPKSEQGKVIQAQYDRQRMTQALNKSKQNMTAAMNKAKSAQEANQIRSKFLAANPYLTSAGSLREHNKRIDKAVKTGFTNLGPKGNPLSVTTPRTYLYDSKGQQVGSTTGGSVKTKSDFFETQKQTKATTDFFGVSTKTVKPEKPVYDMTLPVGDSYKNFLAMPSMSLKSQPDDSQFLSESQKAFGFLPSPSEIKGTDPFSELGQGALKGSSNIMASFWNIGETVRGTVTGTEIKPVGYYGTPITRAELTFFGVAEKGIGSATGGDAYSWEKAGADTQKGLSGAGKEFQTDFFGSVGSLVEAGPYLIGGGISKGIQTGAKLGTNFFGKTATTTSKALAKSDNIMGSGGVKVSKTDYFSGFFRDTKRGLGVGTTKTGKGTKFKKDSLDLGKGFGLPGKVSKTKFKKDSLNLGYGLGMKGTGKQVSTGFFGKSTPKKLTKKTYDDSLGKNFFTSGKGQQLIQVVKTKQIAKTKQLTKTKQVPKVKVTTAQSFFGKVKTVPKLKLKTKTKVKSKTKQKAGLAFFPMYKTQTKQKVGPTQLKKQKQAGGTWKSQRTRLIPPVIIPPFTPSGRGGSGGGVPAWLRGRRGGGGNRKRKGRRTYYGWNINIKKVGSTHKGPAYVTSKNALDIDKYLSAKGTKAKKGKAFGSNGADFFG